MEKVKKGQTMYKDLAYFYGVCISVSIGMWACSPRKIDSTSSILQGEESCSGEPSRFVEMPPNCQHKVLSNLSDKQLIIFAKAVSKSTSKAGFAVLLDRAKLTVPESLQSEIENYASKFYQCMDIPQSTSIKASPVFVERLLAFYLSYVKLMNTRYPSENFPKNPSQQFEIGRFWILTPVNPVVLGKKNVVYVREKKDDARRFLEVRDSATFKLKSSKELVGGQSAEIALQALGPQVLLVKDSTGKTIWTFAENQ